jgi:hypothetical protein
MIQSPARMVRGMFRRPRLGLVLVGGCLALVGLALVTVLNSGAGPSPGSVSARVTRCDLGGFGAAQVGYAVVNGDRAEHNYRVRMTVASGPATLGLGYSLVNHVAPGATASAQALVPLTGDPAGATCSVQAEVYDGTIGHHGSN